MLNVIMLNVIMLNVIMLNVIMLNVFMLSAVAPMVSVTFAECHKIVLCAESISAECCYA